MDNEDISCNCKAIHLDPDSIELSHYESKNQQIEERVQNLKNVISELNDKIIHEKETWMKEVDEAMKLAKSYENHCHCETESCYTSSLSNDVDITDSEPTMSLVDYEQKLAHYQSVLTRAHIEKRNCLKRQLAANAYKQRLMEVENMCNIELLKVRKNFQHLRPLQTMISEWEFNSNNSAYRIDEEITGPIYKKEIQIEISNDLPKRAIGDVNYRENVNEPSSTFASSVSLTHDDKECLRNKRIYSMNWYNNEMNYDSVL